MHASPSECERDVTRLVARVGFLLLHFGAESRVVADLSRRVGVAMGLEHVEVALTSSAVIITGRVQGHCVTTVRECTRTVANMRVVNGVQKLCLAAERHKLSLPQLAEALDKIEPRLYPQWLVVPMIGASCAVFCHLSGGGLIASAVTFLAAAVGMWVRRLLVKAAFNLLLVFGLTACVSSLISGASLHLGLPEDQASLAMAASVLMLVPGFPLINAVADMLKGYVTMGISRWAQATLLTIATSMGIVLAMQLLGAWTWL